MTRAVLSFLPAGPLLLVLALAGCSQTDLGTNLGGSLSGQTPQGRVDAATMEACRQRANEIYDKQNRGTIYAPSYGVNNPMSGNYTPGIERGLSQQFGYEQMLRECIRNAGINRDTAAPAPASAPSGSAASLPGAKAPPPPSAR